MSGNENSTHAGCLCLTFPMHHSSVRKVLRTPFLSLPFISNKSGLLFALFRVEFGNFRGEERELFWGKGSCAMCIREGAKKFSRQMMSPSASLSAQTLCVSVLFSPFPFLAFSRRHWHWISLAFSSAIARGLRLALNRTTKRTKALSQIPIWRFCFLA